MAKYKDFNGYKPEVREFFAELKLNNSKEWFDKHRKFYEEHIRDTSKSLIYEIAMRFAEMEVPYVADTRKSMFRINRDIRFSKNKDPYKTNLGVFFPYTTSVEVKFKEHPNGMYFHIDSDSVFIGAGVYMPQTAYLKEIRTEIADNLDEYEEISNDPEFRKEFPNHPDLEKLKRVPNGFPKDHPGAEILKKKDFIFTCTVDHDVTHSADFIDFLLNKAESALPLHDFLNVDM